MNQFIIIVPTLNSYEILKNLVNSIKSQTLKSWKVLFIDGGSNKNHINYLKELNIEDKRFSFYRQLKSKRGIFGAMNQGLDLIDKNCWFLFLGSDDMLKDKFTLERINFKINSLDLKKIDLLVCKGKYFDIIKKSQSREAFFIKKKGFCFLNVDNYKKLIYRGFTPPHQTTLFNGNSEIFLERYNENFKIASDLELFCRIAKYKSLSLANLSLNIVSISTGGISEIKFFSKFKEVFLCYFKHFKFRFIFPLFCRYYFKIRNLK